jgi:hypothetical protein
MQTERNEMETNMAETYNPNLLVTYKSINNGEATYPTVKVNELETIIAENQYRVNQLSSRLQAQEKQIGAILNNLTAHAWYDSGTSKEEVLSELCDILGHEPKQTIRITATVQVEVDYECPLNELEDFDAKYFLQDVLTIDSFNGDTMIDSFDVEDADWATA